jgi:hypothetical protein
MRDVNLEPKHNRAIREEIGERLRLLLSREQGTVPPRLRSLVLSFGEVPPSAARGHAELAMKRALKPLGYGLVTVYFVADLVFEALALPLSAWMGRLKILQPLNAWIAGLRPYPALALFSAPVVILEPVKPVGAFLVSTGRVVEGTLTIVAGEILKITLVERLFSLTRDRLMQIPTFAILYRHWIRFHEWVTSSKIWRWAREQIVRLKSIFGRGVAA